MFYRLVLCVILLVGITAVPVSGSLTKVTAGAPVFIGEKDLDITAPLNGCHQIAWWPAGNDTSQTPPDKIVEIKDDIHKYSINPAVFSGYEGRWYSWDLKPSILVFEVVAPRFNLSVWDTDHDRDVTGQTIPLSTHVTYRIDTNLYQALDSRYRPDVTPFDLISDASLTGSNGKAILYVYNGNAGAKDTLVLPFDSKPTLRVSPYYWKSGRSWDHTARSGNGEYLYAPGTYTFNASQNLNNMRSYYNDTVGITISGDKTVTFIPDEPTAAPTVSLTTLPLPATTVQLTTQTVVISSPEATTPAEKPTWTSTPLPPWVALVAICALGLWINLSRKL